MSETSGRRGRVWIEVRKCAVKRRDRCPNSGRKGRKTGEGWDGKGANWCTGGEGGFNFGRLNRRSTATGTVRFSVTAHWNRKNAKSLKNHPKSAIGENGKTIKIDFHSQKKDDRKHTHTHNGLGKKDTKISDKISEFTDFKASLDIQLDFQLLSPNHNPSSICTHSLWKGQRWVGCKLVKNYPKKAAGRLEHVLSKLSTAESMCVCVCVCVCSWSRVIM